MKKAQYFVLEHYSDNKNNRVKITRMEAERAVYAMATGRVFLSANGAIAGNSISSIKPDLHRAMGFNEDYKFTGEDYRYVERDVPEYLNAMEYINTKVKYCIEKKQENLIGTDFDIPELQKPEEVSKISGKISNNFKIK
jgi:hypothetical protein